ncbi:MAG: hypothetical protein QM784_08855 [Polyangiaceae bacterium]
MTQGRLDALATRDGAIVVYANAAPGPYSSDVPTWPNADTWRHDTRDDGEVDDVVYVEMVLEDLQKRGVISGANDVYLMGISIGGGMVLRIAKALPGRVKGIAPFMAYDGWQPTPVPLLNCSGISRILFGISSEDPGLPSGYRDELWKIASEWATAFWTASRNHRCTDSHGATQSRKGRSRLLRESPNRTPNQRQSRHSKRHEFPWRVRERSGSRVHRRWAPVAHT